LSVTLNPLSIFITSIISCTSWLFSTALTSSKVTPILSPLFLKGTIPFSNLMALGIYSVATSSLSNSTILSFVSKVILPPSSCLINPFSPLYSTLVSIKLVTCCSTLPLVLGVLTVVLVVVGVALLVAAVPVSYTHLRAHET
jgi:hypothetical protein